MSTPQLGRKITVTGLSQWDYSKITVTGVVTYWPARSLSARQIEIDGKRTMIPRYDVTGWNYEEN